MGRADDYQSYRPAAHDTRRELSAAGQLSDSAWRVSAQALEDFLSRVYTPAEVERALEDAVRQNRFGLPAVSGQRNNLKLYFAVSRLMQKHRIAQLPWSQRELDRLLGDFAREPSIREIDVDFRSIMNKLVRNGAFDHLAGLTTTLVSTQYLPDVRRLMERRQGEHMTARPTEARATSRISPTPTPTGPPSNRNASFKAGAGTAKDTPKEPTPKSKEPPKRPSATKETPVEQSKAAPQPSATSAVPKPQSATAGSPRPATSTVAIQTSSTYKATVEEGLETLSEANLMPPAHQYELFKDVLGMLERSCFFWATRTVPSILRKKRWTAWQQVVILEWLEYFALPDTPLSISPEARSILIDKTLPGLRKMHNDHITRKALPVNAVVLTIEHAQSLLKALEDDACANILETTKDSLKNTESRSAETRSRLKLEFQQAAVSINQKYTRIMENELKEKVIAMNADLEKHLESCDWGLKFVAPSDDYYQVYFSPEVRPGNAPGVPRATGSDTRPTKISSPRNGAGTVSPVEKSHHIANTNNTIKPNVSGPARQDVPAVNTLEYEQYWLGYSSQNKGPIRVSMVPEALNLNDKAWEEFQRAAVKIMDQHNLTDVRAKDQKPKFNSAMQAFQNVNRHIFQHIKIKAFVDFLCGITFKHVSRMTSDSARRAKELQPSVEDDTLEIRGSRPFTSYEGLSAVLPAEARRLEAVRAAPVSAVYTRPATEYGRTSRPGADAFFGQSRSAGQTSAKRSLSPSGNRDDLHKKIKMEPLSQDDLILLEQPTNAEVEAAAFEASMRVEGMLPSIESISSPPRGWSYRR